MEMKMTGDVILMTQRVYPAIYVTQRQEIEAQVVTQANHALGTLVSETRLLYDSKQNSLAYRSMLVSKSNMADAPTTAIGIQLDSKNPIPKLRFEFRFPKLSGSVASFSYSAVDVKVVVELTPTGNPPTGPSAQPLRAPESSTRWDHVIGAGLVAGAVVLVVGTLVEDFFTAGAGAVDDPASFAAAAAGVVRGLQMIRGATVALPAASVAAALALSVTIGTANAPAGVVR
jgi:hypothetical protein